MKEQEEHIEQRTDLGSLPFPIEIRQVSLSGPQTLAMLYGGLIFLLASLGSVSAMIWWSIKYVGFPAYRSDSVDGYNTTAILNYYLPFLFNPIILLISAVVCAIVGYLMLRAAGAIGRDVIPRQDYELLSKLLAGEKDRSIDLYIKLTSLSGATGFFTKIGISGLPLATIFLTIVFSLVGFYSGNDKLLDFANLTLGAFLGSYVQKKVSGNTAEQSGGQGA